MTYNTVDEFIEKEVKGYENWVDNSGCGSSDAYIELKPLFQELRKLVIQDLERMMCKDCLYSQSLIDYKNKQTEQ